MIFGKSLAFDQVNVSEAASAAEDSIANAASEDYFVQCLQNGDPEAFDKLILRFSPDIYGILFRL
ncbi:hypothetical protein OFB94_29055, partial [Escherichia coli]|nr:hypothetical protein [Escherichia coli]